MTNAAEMGANLPPFRPIPGSEQFDPVDRIAADFGPPDGSGRRQGEPFGGRIDFDRPPHIARLLRKRKRLFGFAVRQSQEALPLPRRERDRKAAAAQQSRRRTCARINAAKPPRPEIGAGESSMQLRLQVLKEFENSSRESYLMGKRGTCRAPVSSSSSPGNIENGRAQAELRISGRIRTKPGKLNSKPQRIQAEKWSRLSESNRRPADYKSRGYTLKTRLFLSKCRKNAVIFV